MGVKEAMREVGAKVVEGSSDKDLMKMFETANAACPTRMDAFTTLEDIKLIDEQRAEFRYIVNDEGKQLLTRVNKRMLKKAAVEHMKGNAIAVAVAERDLSIEHIYEDSQGKHLLSYTINRAVLAGDLDPIGDEQANRFGVKTVNADAADSVLEENVKPAPIVEPPLPQKFQMPRRTKDNPAGVQGNPFFSET